MRPFAPQEARLSNTEMADDAQQPARNMEQPRQCQRASACASPEALFDPREILGEDEIHLWYAFPDRIHDRHLLERYVTLLSDDERARHQAFYFDRDRHHYLVAHALLRTTLSRYAAKEPQAWRFEQNQYGKPRVRGLFDGVELQFNLTHTRGLAACAVARHIVGVDAEWLDRRVDLSIAERYFAEPEVLAMQRLPVASQPKRFLEIWTLKEAYVKAVGKGLTLPLDSFWLGLYEDRQPTIAFTDSRMNDPRDWSFWSIDSLSPQHLLAVAIRRHRDLTVKLAIRQAIPLDGSASKSEIRNSKSETNPKHE